MRTVPRGAQVLVDGRTVGRSDLLLEDLAEGRSEVVVRKDGYTEARRQVRLERGATALASFRLEPRAGTVRVRVEGPEEFLLATPDDSWESPKTLRLEPGEHRFLVRALGWKDRSVRVKVEPGREARLSVKLERMAVPNMPVPQAPAAPPDLPSRPTTPSWQPPAWTPPTVPSAPAPRFTPLPQAPRTPPPPPRVTEPPAPAFTPVAPPPAPPTTEPGPILTPVSP